MRMCLGRMKAWPFLTGPSGGGVEVVETSYFQGQVWPGMVGGEPQCACAVSALLLPAGWAYTLTLSNYLSHISPPHHRSQPQQHQQKIVSFHQNFPQEKTQQYQEYSWNLSVFWLHHQMLWNDLISVVQIFSKPFSCDNMVWWKTFVRFRATELWKWQQQFVSCANEVGWWQQIFFGDWNIFLCRRTRTKSASSSGGSGSGAQSGGGHPHLHLQAGHSFESHDRLPDNYRWGGI